MRNRKLKIVVIVLIILNIVFSGIIIALFVSPITPFQLKQQVALSKKIGASNKEDFFALKYKPLPLNLENDEMALEVPILMYHDIIPTELPEYDGNKMLVDTFKEQLQYLSEQGYRTLTIEEFDKWYRGEIEVPKKSILLTFDDGFRSIKDLVEPLLIEYNFHVVSFVIGEKIVEPYFVNQTEITEIGKRNFVEFQSHSFAMHNWAGNKRGAIETIGATDGAADNEKMKPIVGTAKMFCYPFGHGDGGAQEVLKESHIPYAVTTAPGLATRGTDPLALPRVRMNAGVSLKQFIANIDVG